MSARDLISGEAELDSQEEDESFDEETGQVRRKPNGVNGINGRIDDSSEEEDDDDDEEAAAEVSAPEALPSTCPNTDRLLCSRLEKTSSSKMTKNPKSASVDGASEKSGEEKSVRRMRLD